MATHAWMSGLLSHWKVKDLTGERELEQDVTVKQGFLHSRQPRVYWQEERPMFLCNSTKGFDSLQTKLRGHRFLGQFPKHNLYLSHFLCSILYNKNTITKIIPFSFLVLWRTWQKQSIVWLCTCTCVCWATPLTASASLQPTMDKSTWSEMSSISAVLGILSSDSLTR